MSAQQWTRVGINVTSRPLVDERGQPLLNPVSGTQVGLNVSNAGGPTYHWMDAALFGAWVAEARRQERAARTNRDPAAMQRAASAIMAAYNALNIPWMIDPKARNLHRIFVAGAPSSRGVSSRDADFGGVTRYNETLWISHDSGRCIIAPGVINGSIYAGCDGDSEGGRPSSSQITPGPYTATIPATARGMFNTLAPDRPAAAGDPTQFLPRIQFITRVQDGSQLPQWYQPGQGSVNVPFPFDPGSVGAATLSNDVVWTSERKQYYRHADGSDAADDPDGWDVYAFDLNGIGVQRQQVRPTWQDYAIYLQSWVDALESRTAEQVVQDARAYAMWRNSMAENVAGGFTSLVGGMIRSVDNLNVPDAQLSGAIRTSGALATATAASLGVVIGLAVTGATAATGIGALIGGAITALSFVAAALVAPNFDQYNIDDLERPKPWIERSWLSGNPADASAAAGAPTIDIDAPPGFVRSQISGTTSRGLHELITQAERQGTIQTSSDNTPAVPSFWSSVPVGVWWTLGGLAIGSVIAYAGSKLTQGRSRSRNRTSRRSKR